MEPRPKHLMPRPVFQNAAFDNHQDVVFCNDPGSGLRAIIAIHDTTLGPALGGTRMYPYANEAQALRDVLRLSKGMTLKNAIARIPYGGGKAVIIGDPKTDKTPELLRAYAGFIDRLKGRFITGEDVGIRVADADIINQVTRHIRGTSSGHAGDPSPYTALGVFAGIKAAVEHKFCSLGVGGLSVSVQGLGAVGMSLAQLLHDAGAELIVSDIRKEAMTEAAERFGARLVSPGQAHSTDADIFAPCAMGGILNQNSIPEIRARIVAGSANNQLQELDDGARLNRAGILYAPDYVINAGGVISIAHDTSEFDPDELAKHVSGIGEALRKIFRMAERSQRPTSSLADEMAWARIKRPDDHGCAA